ncbi:protein SHORTAGE IN CHIASMATA 1 homolog isoform X3 [Musa acuminata AAA Group]|uniref:protein SHORTAGE IN CHIASMATA 1 homolog isoform X3 n=1 Tax=Musa acuminata AAA Group TaxID=214697 RepID=UPI0031D568FF
MPQKKSGAACHYEADQKGWGSSRSGATDADISDVGHCVCLVSCIGFLLLNLVWPFLVCYCLQEVSILIQGEKDVDECLDLRSSVFVAKDLEGNELLKEHLFEIVELDLPLGESMGSSKTEEAGIYFKIPDITIPLDSLDIDVEVTVIYPHKVAKSTYLVDDIHAKSDKEEFSPLKVNSSSVDRTLDHNMILPQLEVHEHYLDPDAGIANAEVLSCMLPLFEACDGHQVDKLAINANEFLESNSVDIMEHISEDTSMDYFPEEKPMSLSSILDMNVINLGDIMLLERGSVIYCVAANGDYSHMPCSVHYQEVQNFDFPSDDVLQIVVNSQQAKTLDMTELMVIDDMDFAGGLYQSFVSTELALIDDTFKSLPTPILCDDKAIKSVSMVVEELLHALKPHSLSASDGIYLDWHPLLEGVCNREICFTYMNMLHNVSSCSTTSDLQTDIAENAAIDIDFFDDFLENVDTLQCEELPTELHRNIPHITYSSSKPESTQMPNNGKFEENAERKVNIITQKTSFLSESMSQSNDLSFFLDVRKGTSMGNYKDGTVKCSDKHITAPIAVLQEPSIPCGIPKEVFAQWVIDVHTVCLSDHILGLMDHIKKSYSAILEESPYLKADLVHIANESETSSLSRQKLLNLIINKISKRCTSDSSHEDVMAYVALYGIKQLSYFLCFFGVHAAHLYVSYLVRNIKTMAERLRSLEALLEDECWKSGKQLIDPHPSLSLIEGLLMSNIQNSEKILIVAERVFWLPLTWKLASMGIKLHAVKANSLPPSNLDGIDSTEYDNSVLEHLHHSDCLLVSYENVSTSFPFNNFSVILEYGGPYASSRLSSLHPKSDALPQVHFIHVKIENHLTPIVLCEGFHACSHPGSTRIFEGESSFLAAIMESSDALYAAAASLDMNLQLFCSHDADSTDDIILSCIRSATRSAGDLYPAMPESESIGESFLTRFPSINPLSAHVILSSGGSLVEFLEWSNERRIQAVGKYHVPEESISLFSALCRYGEVGESKSVMTESSSIDSDFNSRLLSSPRKKRRHACHTYLMPSGDSFLAEPLNQNISTMEEPPAFQQYQLRNFSNIQEKMGKIKSNYYSDMLGKRPSGSTVIDHDLNSLVRHSYINKDFIDDINQHDYNFLEEKFPLASDKFSFLEKPELGIEPADRSSHAVSPRGLRMKGHSIFPSSTEIHHDTNKRSSMKDHYLSFDDMMFKHEPVCSRRDNVLIKTQEYQKEKFMQDHRTNIVGLSAQEKVPPAYGENEFSNATQPSRSQGQCWITDFLHRLKEKGNGQQQTLPRNPCFNCRRTSNVKDRPSRSQSPSVIDTYRYQGSNQTRNTTKNKWRKDAKRPSISNKRECKESSFITRTWTPIDKRARQNLSFTKNGNEKQSKLVWRNRNSPNVGCSIRKRCRDDR